METCSFTTDLHQRTCFRHRCEHPVNVVSLDKRPSNPPLPMKNKPCKECQFEEGHSQACSKYVELKFGVVNVGDRSAIIKNPTPQSCLKTRGML